MSTNNITTGKLKLICLYAGTKEKVEVYPYSEDFPKLFEEKKEEILNLYQDCEIHHIGSTAVQGLGGKGIIDILIAIDNWGKEDEILKTLKELGYPHTHKRENGRRFVSKEPSEVGYKDFHIHIVKKNNSQYEELLSFRDYLRNNPSKAKEYLRLKRKQKAHLCRFTERKRMNSLKE